MAGEGTTGSDGPGQQLQLARIERELSLEEVGDALNLTAQTVGWLEEERYDELPTAAFTQGYLRNYAKFVGLEPDSIVAAYQRTAGAPGLAWQTPEVPNSNMTEIAQRHPGMLLSGVVAAVAVLVLAVLIMVWPQSDDSPSVAEGGASGSPSPAADPDAPPPFVDAPSSRRAAATTVPAPRTSRTIRAASAEELEAPRPVLEAMNNAPAASGSGDAASSASTTTARATARRAEPAPEIDEIDPDDPLAHLPIARTYPVERSSESAASSEPLPEVLLDPNRITPFGTDVIGVSFTDESWFEVRDGDDKLLYSLLGSQGQTVELVGEGPFRVVFGYAPGAELRYNSQEVVLDPYIRNNVASVVIGQ